MLEAVLSWLGGVLASLVTGALAGWRRDRALVNQGRAEQRAETALDAASATDRIRKAEQAATDEILASPDRARVIDRLRHRQF